MELKPESSPNPVINIENQEFTKRYCDRSFRLQLAKSLKVNFGEPENFDKIRSNKLLCQYDPEKIVEYTNNLAADIQNNVEKSITTPRTKEILDLAINVETLTDDIKPMEVPLAIKLHSVSKTPIPSITNNVNFDALNKYLFSAVTGGIDHVDMNYETKLVLQDTFNMLMEQVEADAPRVLQDLRSRMNGETECPENIKAENLKEHIENSYLNPFNIPIEFLLQSKTSDK